MNKIQETKDYDKFELNPFNRESKHNTKKFNELLESMREYGWIDAYPMHVVANGNGKLKIKAGHNRRDAAEILGIPVKYVICDDKIPLTRLEVSHNAWNMKDFMCGFANQGDSNYAKLSAFIKKYRLPVMVSMGLLRGGSAQSGGRQVDKFKFGEFKIGNPSHANLVGDLVLFCEELGIEFCRNSRFVIALSKVVLVDGLDVEELKKKIRNHLYMMAKQADISGYVTMLEKIYNRQRSHKLAIAINALS